MMVLSRLWYVVLALLLGILAYVVFLAVGQYDRRNAVAMEEELASDSQTVGWSLQIDARKRLDALLIGAVDKGVQDALQGAAGKDTIPGKSKEDGKHALAAVVQKIPPDFRPDALFAVDHDGRVVSEVGFDGAKAFADFELGGYPAVFDALHGYLRDDTWVLGGAAYRVVARPVEVDSTQPPLGAIVGLKLVDKAFAQALSKRTRANVAFFAGGARVASATAPGFEEAKLSAVDGDLASLATDKGFGDGRSELHALGDNLGAIYARFVGDAWDLSAGFVVVRSRTTIGGPMGFLSGADDKDKQSVNLVLVGGIVFLGIVIGIGLSILEHTLPLGQMVKQAGALRRGEIDYLQVVRFRGAYRGIAENLNAGIERVLEKGGGAVRKPADLESILGPVPVQPAMSAFSFPLPDQGPGPGPVPPARPPGAPPPGPQAPPPGAMAFPVPGPQAPAAASPPPVPAGPPPPLNRPKPPPSHAGLMGIDTVPAITPTGPPGARPANPRASGAAFPPAGPPIPPPAGAGPPRPGNFQIAVENSPESIDGDGPTLASAASPLGLPIPPPARGPAPRAEAPQDDAPTMAVSAMNRPGVHEAAMKLGMGPPVPPAAGARPGPPAVGTQTMMGIGLSEKSDAGGKRAMIADDADESTVIARAPSEILAAASGPSKAVSDETAEWMGVYDEFLRTKKQCDEPTEGLSFEKFQNTLRKNRDALVQRHQCKRVRFSVYVKDGRASLKATPVKE